MTLAHLGSRRNAAPVNGAMYGTPASAATGVAERDVGVPTAPIRANTCSSSISRRVLAIAASGSYASSSEINSSWRPCTPPRSFASRKAARMPRRMFLPSSWAGPLKAADWPNTMRSSNTPTSAAGATARKHSRRPAASTPTEDRRKGRFMRTCA